MGATIIICLTLILAVVAICVTYLMSCLIESDESRVLRENRKLREMIDKCKNKLNIKEDESD